MINRRTFLTVGGGIGLCAVGVVSPSRPGRPFQKERCLMHRWNSQATGACRRLKRCGSYCCGCERSVLSGLRLLSDQQPEMLRVENRKQGGPAIWLHDDQPEMAWVIVDIGPVDWSKLAYQFGHELGHVSATVGLVGSTGSANVSGWRRP